MAKLDKDGLLPHLPKERIKAIYAAAPGNEIASGKFAHPESSAALAANTFGFFLDCPADLPDLVAGQSLGLPARNIALEGIVRFPWSGGRHPCLDVLVDTDTTLIGIESKRYEPFRSKPKVSLSDAYWRDVWGENMVGYELVRNGLKGGILSFSHLDAAQLVKHAFGLRTEVHKAKSGRRGRRPTLFYLYAEPQSWSDGKPVFRDDINRHRDEIALFANIVAGDEVVFHHASYQSLFRIWNQRRNNQICAHVDAILAGFKP